MSANFLPRITTVVRIWAIRNNSYPLAQVVIAARRWTDPLLNRIFSRSPRQSAITGAVRGSTDRCLWEWIPMRFPRQAQQTALEVLAANGVETIIQADNGYTPTPVISHAILTYNRGRYGHLADGIVITPSHNPPRDGGFKYNATNGGPADVEITQWVQDRANELLRAGNVGVQRIAYERAAAAATTHARDLALPYIRDLDQIIDLDAIRSAGLSIGADPLGGASVAYWQMIAEIHGLNISVVNKTVDPTFSFMTVDHDGQIRMDCSSPYAMAKLIDLKDRYRLAFGNDPDSDRHGIVTPSAGLMNPNHYLATAIRYLFTHRPRWNAQSGVGKTLVSSGIIDRVAASLGRPLVEVPVGFKWFVDRIASMARLALAARRVPGQASCVTMARSGAPIRTE